MKRTVEIELTTTDDLTYAAIVAAVAQAVRKHGQILALRSTRATPQMMSKLRELDPDGGWNQYSGSVHAGRA